MELNQFTDIESLATFIGISFTTLLIIVLAITIIKGCALWKSAQNKSKVWFWVLFLVNTLGILDLAYLFFFSKRRRK